MARFRSLGSLTIAGIVLAATSCRSILDITPGRPLDDSGGAAGKATGGKPNSSTAGTDATGGDPDPGSGGAPPSTAGKGSGGTSKGGAAQAGSSSNVAGEGMAGMGENPPISPFPEGSCRACIERNCPTEQQACIDQPACVTGIDTWLACDDPDATQCVTAEAGMLQDLESCGAKSCDVCRNVNSTAPAIEILTPSNGAAVAPDGSGLIEVSVKVHNATLKGLGLCGTDVACGHVHLNLDGANCLVTGFYNSWITMTQPDGTQDATIDTTACKTSIVGRPLALTASLSSHTNHADRVPKVQSTVTITIPE